MPKIVIPTALRQYAGNTAAVDVQGATAGEVLASLTSQYPELKKHLYDANGKLRSFVNVFVNDEDIRGLQNENIKSGSSDCRPRPTRSSLRWWFAQKSSRAPILTRRRRRNDAS